MPSKSVPHIQGRSAGMKRHGGAASASSAASPSGRRSLASVAPKATVKSTSNSRSRSGTTAAPEVAESVSKALDMARSLSSKTLDAAQGSNGRPAGQAAGDATRKRSGTTAPADVAQSVSRAFASAQSLSSRNIMAKIDKLEEEKKKTAKKMKKKEDIAAPSAPKKAVGSTKPAASKAAASGKESKALPKLTKEASGSAKQPKAATGNTTAPLKTPKEKEKEKLRKVVPAQAKLEEDAERAASPLDEKKTKSLSDAARKIMERREKLKKAGRSSNAITRELRGEDDRSRRQKSVLTRVGQGSTVRLFNRRRSRVGATVSESGAFKLPSSREYPVLPVHDLTDLQRILEKLEQLLEKATWEQSHVLIEKQRLLISAVIGGAYNLHGFLPMFKKYCEEGFIHRLRDNGTAEKAPGVIVEICSFLRIVAEKLQDDASDLVYIFIPALVWRAGSVSRDVSSEEGEVDRHRRIAAEASHQALLMLFRSVRQHRRLDFVCTEAVSNENENVRANCFPYILTMLKYLGGKDRDAAVQPLENALRQGLRDNATGVRERAATLLYEFTKVFDARGKTLLSELSDDERKRLRGDGQAFQPSANAAFGKPLNDGRRSRDSRLKIHTALGQGSIRSAITANSANEFESMVHSALKVLVQPDSDWFDRLQALTLLNRLVRGSARYVRLRTFEDTLEQLRDPLARQLDDPHSNVAREAASLIEHLNEVLQDQFFDHALYYIPCLLEALVATNRVARDANAQTLLSIMSARLVAPAAVDLSAAILAPPSSNPVRRRYEAARAQVSAEALRSQLEMDGAGTALADYEDGIGDACRTLLRDKNADVQEAGRALLECIGAVWPHCADDIRKSMARDGGDTNALPGGDAVGHFSDASSEAGALRMSMDDVNASILSLEEMRESIERQLSDTAADNAGEDDDASQAEDLSSSAELQRLGALLSEIEDSLASQMERRKSLTTRLQELDEQTKRAEYAREQLANAVLSPRNHGLGGLDSETSSVASGMSATGSLPPRPHMVAPSPTGSFASLPPRRGSVSSVDPYADDVSESAVSDAGVPPSAAKPRPMRRSKTFVNKLDGLTNKWMSEMMRIVRSDTNDDWELRKSEDDVQVHSKPVGRDQEYTCIRGSGTIPASVDEVFATIAEPDAAKLWDPFFLSGRVVERLTDKHAVVHLKYQSQSAFFDNRDYCCMHSTSDTIDGSRIVLFRSVLHDQVPVFESGFVRGEILLSGFVVRPARDAVARCRLYYILQMDPKGWVPGFVSDMFAVEQAMCIGMIRRIVASNTK